MSPELQTYCRDMRRLLDAAYDLAAVVDDTYRGSLTELCDEELHRFVRGGLYRLSKDLGDRLAKEAEK